MKKLIFIIALALTGCASTGFKNKEILVQKEYIVRTAPNDLKALPPYPNTIDPMKANQLELAQWLLENEKYMYSLEGKIKGLIEFYEKPVKSDAPAPVTPAASK